MTALDALALSHWESVADSGEKLVIFGVVGEGVELVIKFFEPCLKKKQRWRHFFHAADPWINAIGAIFWIMVVGGLCREFKGNHEAKLILGRDNAELHAEAGKAIERAEELRRQALDIIANLPSNQPVHSVSAFVQLNLAEDLPIIETPEVVQGTNSKIRPILAKLQMLRCGVPKTNDIFVLNLFCHTYDKYGGTCFLYFDWDVRFGAKPKLTFADRSVGQLMEEINGFWIQSLFLPTNFNVKGGTVVLNLNSAFEKTLLIPPQIAAKDWIQGYNPGGTNAPTVKCANDSDEQSTPKNR